MEKRSTISQLDLLLLGRRGITSRIAGVERSVRNLSLVNDGQSNVPDDAVRPNLLLNSSFEFYNRNAVIPNDWAITGNVTLATGVIGADGSTAVLCAPGSYLAQDVAGGLIQQQGSGVLSVAVRANNYGAKVQLAIVHPPGVAPGPVYRLDQEGNEEMTDEVPGDGAWYRFWLPAMFNGGDQLTVRIGCSPDSTTSIYFDAVKYEKEDGVSAFLDPTAFIGSDWGASVHLRNLSADNIVAGTLTVGGSGSGNPRISVQSDTDTEIVTIGDPNNGYYGIDVKEDAGIRVSGSGSVEVVGGGDVVLDNGGDLLVNNGGTILVNGGAINVTGTGGVNVSGGGSVTVNDGGAVDVTGTGKIVAGATNGARTELTYGGLAAYDSNNTKQVELSSADGRLYVYGSGGIVLSGGGSFIAGTPGGARAEYDQTGFSSYNANNELQARLSAVSGKLELSADAISLLSNDPLELPALAVSGELNVGQDLRVGTNVLFVDQSQQNIGINRAPDYQFALDINGSVRWSGYAVGKMALQLNNALLIAHYDGTIKPGDYTGNADGHYGQKANITGTVSYFEGKFNKSIYTSSGYPSYLAKRNTIRPYGGTLMVWARPNSGSLNTERAIVVYGTPGQNGFFLRHTQNGAVRLEIYNSGTYSISSPDNTLVVNGWSHLAVTWGNGAVSLYIDGQYVGSVPGITEFSYPAETEYLSIGGRPGGGSPNWNGLIDDLVVLKDAATLSLIRAVYESDAPVFAETSAWGFKTPNTLAWADEEGLWALASDGTTAFAVCGVNNKSWGTASIDSGDVFIGVPANYVWWDASASQLRIKGELTASAIDGGTITGTTISGSTITGTAIIGSTITGNTINGGTITGTNISGSTITGNTINGATITGATISGSTITGGNVTFDNDGIAITTTIEYSSASAITFVPNNPSSPASTVLYDINGFFNIESEHGILLTTTVEEGILNNIIFITDTYVTIRGPAYQLNAEFDGITIRPSTDETRVATFNENGLLVYANSASGGNIAAQNKLSAGVWASIGSGGLDYSPNSSNVFSGSANLVLNGSTYTSIAFHDNDNRVDAIVAGGGTIKIGPDIGWGPAAVEVGSTLVVNTNAGINDQAYSWSTCTIRSQNTSTTEYALVVRDPTPANLFYARNDGFLWANRAWYIGSDGRNKKNVEDVAKARDKIKQVKFRKYRRVLDNLEDVGVVAQELRDVYPELVVEVIPPGEDTQREPELSVNYQGLTVYLGKALQELDEELDRTQKQAKRRIDELETRLAELERLVARNG